MTMSYRQVIRWQRRLVMPMIASAVYLSASWSGIETLSFLQRALVCLTLGGFLLMIVCLLKIAIDACFDLPPSIQLRAEIADVKSLGLRRYVIEGSLLYVAPCATALAFALGSCLGACPSLEMIALIAVLSMLLGPFLMFRRAEYLVNQIG